MTRHKHADVAEAFGNGVAIQNKHKGEWVTWKFAFYPNFYDYEEWRIKPEESELVAMYLWAIRFNDDSVFVKNIFAETEEEALHGYVNAVEAIRLDYTKQLFKRGAK